MPRSGQRRRSPGSRPPTSVFITVHSLKVLACFNLKALLSVCSLQVTLQSFSFFEHRHSCTVWLDPGPSPGTLVATMLVCAVLCRHGAEPQRACEELSALQATLAAAFSLPGSDHGGPHSTDAFTPHLSIGQWPNRAAAQAAVQACALLVCLALFAQA